MLRKSTASGISPPPVLTDILHCTSVPAYPSRNPLTDGACGEGRKAPSQFLDFDVPLVSDPHSARTIVSVASREDHVRYRRFPHHRDLAEWERNAARLVHYDQTVACDEQSRDPSPSGSIQGLCEKFRDIGPMTFLVIFGLVSWPPGLARLLRSSLNG
jgi:hypothetical protein